MKFIVKFYFLLFSVSAMGQTQSSGKEIRPAFVGLFVNNIETSKNWYETRLGFRVLQYKKVSDQLGFAMMDWNGIWIELIQNPKTISRKSFQDAFTGATDVEGFFKLGFYAENLEQLEKEFKEKGIKFKYPMMSNDNLKMKLFIIEDIEGNWIQFYRLEKQG